MNIENEIKKRYDENESWNEVGKPMEIKFVSVNEFSQEQIEIKEEIDEDDVGVAKDENHMECIANADSYKYELLDIDDYKVTYRDDTEPTYEKNTNDKGTAENKDKSNSEHYYTIYLDRWDTFRTFVCSGKKTFKCNLCEFQSEYKPNLRRHIRRKHETVNKREYKCTKSEDQIREEQLLYNDRKESSMNPYGCNICNKGFSTAYTLKHHISLHSEDKRFYCIYCNYKTHNKNYLMIHFKDKHSGKDKEHKCSECQYQTNYKQNFNRHVKMHTVASNKISKFM